MRFVRVGEQVRVVTREGIERQFEVIAVEADALVGKDVRVARDDIVALEVRRISSTRNLRSSCAGNRREH